MPGPEPRRGFATPPEVTGYFRGRALRPAFSWLDVFGEEHAHAFTVAKAVQLDILKAFEASIDRSLAAGQGYDTWKPAILAKLKELGVTGPIRVRDERGGIAGPDRDAKVDFTSDRRLRTIFQSNVAAARAAGQWDRMQRTKSALPYILYVRTTAAEPRPEHLRWAGTLLPIDDPFWATHFPPNGWRCKCSVRQVSRPEAERLGGPTPAPEIAYETRRNRRTGEVVRVPEGIDYGWHFNHGLARAKTAARVLVDKLERTPDAIASAAIDSYIGDRRFEEVVYRAQLRAERRAKLGDRTIADASHPWERAGHPAAVWPADLAALNPTGRRIVSLDDVAIAHTPDHHYAPSDWARVPAMIEAAEAWHQTDDPRRPHKVLFVAPDTADRSWFLVVARGLERMEVVTLFRAPARYVRKQIEGLRKVR